MERKFTVKQMFSVKHGFAAKHGFSAQQVFLTAQEKISQVREAQRVRGWLFTVLRRCTRQGIQSASKQRSHSGNSVFFVID